MNFKKNAYDFSRGNIRIFGMGLEMTIAAGTVALNIIYEGKVRMIHFSFSFVSTRSTYLN